MTPSSIHRGGTTPQNSSPVDRGETTPQNPPIQCVGAVIRDETGRMLLILRGHEPSRGLWSIPGGRIEPGETDEQAVAREVAEETGLHVTCGRLLGTAELPGLAGATIVVRDYLADLADLGDLPDLEAGAAGLTAVAAGPTALAGDDAADVRWVTDDEALAMDARGELTSGLLRTLRSWL